MISFIAIPDSTTLPDRISIRRTTTTTTRLRRNLLLEMAVAKRPATATEENFGSCCNRLANICVKGASFLNRCKCQNIESGEVFFSFLFFLRNSQIWFVAGRLLD